MLKSLFAFDNTTDPGMLASFCLETGIDSIILHPGFFENDRFLSTLRRNGLKVWLNIPVFFNEKYLEEHPESYSITSNGNRAIHSWLHMICPGEKSYLALLKNEIGRLIKQVDPDYISYDFIRFFVFWEKADLSASPEHIEHGCYCSKCREAFKRFSGEDIHIAGGVIEKCQRTILGEWKRSVISGIVRELNTVVGDSDKNIPVYIKTIPWKATDLEEGLGWIAGQDIEELGGLSDGIIPMSFTQILGKTPRWKKELLDHVKMITGKEVMSYIQFEPVIRDTPISAAQMEEEIRSAVDEKRAGLIYFHYEQIAGNPEKKEILKKYKTLMERE